MTGKVSALFRSLCLLSILCCCCRREKVTLESLVEEMLDRKKLSHFPEQPYKHKQFSSYNRVSVSPEQEGWYENFDMSHFIRVETNHGRREFVLLDAEGPGAVVRWWMTFYKAQHGMIRMYIDHDNIPVLEGSPSEWLSGCLLTTAPLAVSVQKGALLGEEGRDYDHNFYVPLPFAQHCKITYECDSLVLLYEREGKVIEKGYYWPDVFYNIGCRIYDKRIKVESISRKVLARARPMLEKAGILLEKDEVNSLKEQNFERLLWPGDSLVIRFRMNERAINHLVVEINASNMPQALRSVVMKASFDGHQTIWLPIGEFFGTGYGLHPHQTWMNRRDEHGSMESFWIMPFRDTCDVTFINFGNEHISLRGRAGLTIYKWTASSMYFGAAWHEYRHIQSRDENGSPFDVNIIDIQGKGVYVGDQLTLFNTTYHWWGEGDEKIFVDGESFPSSFGTGSEDYYGYSFARPEPFSHPFISQPEGNVNTKGGLTVNMRHRSLDAIPFNRSISANLELWHWAKVPINLALTSYWYVQIPYDHNIAPDKNGVLYQVAVSTGDFQN